MLYILRHGTTDWNAIKRLQGQTDIPLNEDGRELARRAAEEYWAIHFDLCYCSPLVRARETASIILKDRNIPIIYDDRLKEMSFGIYEGLENYPDRDECPVNVFFKNPEKYDFSIEGGETLAQLFERTGELLREEIFPLVEAGKDVLIVGHGAMNSSIACQVSNIPVKDFWKLGIENCKLKRLI